MLILFFILAAIGFAITLYVFLLEEKIKVNPQYKPACDISENISCTKPIKSPYTNVFYLPNSIVGMLFYISIALFAVLNMPKLILNFAIGGFIASLIFAYILYFKIRSLCVLCVSLYIINIMILILAIQLYYL